MGRMTHSREPMMRSILRLMLFLVVAESAVAAAAPQPRRIQSLDGPWSIAIDPYESGFYDYRAKEKPDGLFKDMDWKRTPLLVEYDFDHSPTLDVPGDWNSQREDLKYYEGTVWYRRAFEASPREGRRQFLVFDAVSYKAIVYFNGEKLGEHEGGFTPFELEVTGKVKAGRNSVVVKVDNVRRKAGIPTLQTDWWNYGGITRSVRLEERPREYMREVTVSFSRKREIEVRVEGGGDFRVEIPELEIAAEGRAGQVLVLAARPELWSPENPRLYKVRVTAGEDLFEDEVGFRTLETRGPDILLNGKSVFLRGISVHDEAPGPTAGRMRTAADARALLTWAKELGCNFVRLAHYPHPELMVREAEKMGLMVWSEIPVYWTIEWENAETKALALRQLEEMIRRDRNRAAVVIWSVGNETPLSATRNVFMSDLVRRARELDSTRLLSAALEQHGGEVREVNDPLGAELDVLGLNEYIGWYDGPPEKARTLTWKTLWQKPLVISEFGADAKRGHHGADEQRWTEEYQAFVYREQLAMLKKIPNLRGLSPWILKDFRSPRRWLPGIQDGWNRKGLVDESGERKLAWKVLNDFYLSSAARRD
jgi:beta-glucuronidase